MSTSLKNKTAIVTGASKGIGAGIAKELASAGASVVVNYTSSKEDAHRTVAAIENNGGKALAVQADVSVAADVKRLFREAKNAFGHIDILVNNAGIFKFDPVEQITEAEFHAQFNTNVLGIFLATQEALNHFPETGGSIVNIGSTVSRNPVLNSSLYSATKAAVDTLSLALARELGSRNIRVNVIAPGATETEGTHRIGVIGSDFEKTLVAATPLGRIGQPDDIAKAVTFVVSDAAAWITGERIQVSGGQN